MARDHRPQDPDYAAKVAASFARQAFMAHLGAELVSVGPGLVETAADLRPHLTQQHGFGHAGLSWALVDTAMGFAAQSLMPPGRTVLTAELKINLLAPAEGRRLVARGEVVRAGRRLVVVQGFVRALGPDGEAEIALATGTFVAAATEERG